MHGTKEERRLAAMPLLAANSAPHQDLAIVSTVAAYRLRVTASPSPGPVLLVVGGTKASACHRMSIVTAQALEPGDSVAVIATPDGGICIPGERPFSYADALDLPLATKALKVISRAPTPEEPKIDEVSIVELDTNSFARIRESLLSRPALQSVSTDTRSGGLEWFNGQHVASQSAAQYFHGDPYKTPVPVSGNFRAQVAFWFAGYGRCEIFLDYEDRRWIFRGEGAGIPGGGGYTGHIGTNDLGRLVRHTAKCSLLAFPIYGQTAFFDSGIGHLGNFDGAGMGAGGGVYAGRWTGPAL